MRRREFIAGLGGAAVWPVVARAQQAAVPVIGYLGARSAAADANYVEGFRQGLTENGYVVGQNVEIEFRWSEGQSQLLPAMAADLVRRRANLIVAAAGGAPEAAKAATATVPIVFSTGGDPVGLGLVGSLSRPGGNLTGVTTVRRDLDGKRLGLLHDVVPSGKSVAFFIQRELPDANKQIAEAQEAARTISVDLLLFDAKTEREFEAAFATAVERGCSGFILAANSWAASRRALVTALAARLRLPGMYGEREFAAAGGLMSYGTSFAANYRQVGVYAGRILKGAKPTDLPIMQPTRFELVINLGAARALNLTIPAGILAIADEVIE
jgi:putative tryptophan/tyrosine transport system substrate-binding protein